MAAARSLYYSGCLAENRLRIDVAPGGELIGWDIAALGLPHQLVRSFSLHFRAGHPVTVDVEYLAYADAPLEPVLRQFVLVDRTTTEPAQAGA